MAQSLDYQSSQPNNKKPQLTEPRKSQKWHRRRSVTRSIYNQLQKHKHDIISNHTYSRVCFAIRDLLIYKQNKVCVIETTCMCVHCIM